MRFPFIRAVTVGALVLSLSGCNKTADAPKVATGPSLPDGRTPSLLIQALDSATMVRMEQRTGNWSEADAASKWRAMASGGKIRLIDETLTAGESSTRRTTHYFTEDGKPAAYIEFRIQTVMTGDKSPEKQFVLLKLEFTGDSASKVEKTVNGVAQPVQPFEIENARKHSMVLFGAAQSAPVTSPATP